jgi:hypothetical protein
MMMSLQPEKPGIPKPSIPLEDVTVLVTELTKLAISEYNRRYVEKFVKLAIEGLKALFWIGITLVIRYLGTDL